MKKQCPYYGVLAYNTLKRMLFTSFHWLPLCICLPDSKFALITLPGYQIDWKKALLEL